MLLSLSDPGPVEITNPLGRSPFLLVADHAGNAVPRARAGLGLDTADLDRHIGWDIGVASLGVALSERIDATLIRQRYSRLVIDCNRAPGQHDAIAPISDGTMVPGNQDLSAAERAARVAEIHEPYHRAIADELTRRDAAGRLSILVALHSFTPVMNGHARPWQIGILHDRGDTRFALACLAALHADPALCVGDNEPYRMEGTDYTVPRHAFAVDRLYVEIEIRQDLLLDRASINHWARRVDVMLATALAQVSAGTAT